MNSLIIPKELNFLINGIDDYWLEVHPLLFKIKTFAKNQIQDGENSFWGRFDYIISPLIVSESIVTFNKGYIKSFAESIRDMSAMEFLPIETHYTLVEIELMSKVEVDKTIGYYKTFSDNFFPYSGVLGSHQSILKTLNMAGNAKVSYHPFHQRKRDIWDNDEAIKTYEFNIGKK